MSSRRRLVVLAWAMVVALALGVVSPVGAVGSTDEPDERARPRLVVTTLLDGLSVPWDLAFTPDGTMLFTERWGRISARRPGGAVVVVDADLSDLFVSGETGLMALEVDPRFAQNRRFYTCQGHVGPEVQVIAWRLSNDFTRATRVNDPLVGGIDLSTGRHGGCRLRFGPEGGLWISTGDGAIGTTPQDITSLAGKVLRVNASSGAGWADNPWSGSPNANTRRLYSIGHRNPQGLARRPGTDRMWVAEHGPNRDDEVNRLRRGGNYGWNPVPGYNEGVPMTFAGGVAAAWSSGSPTLATSGATFIDGDGWGAYDGMLAVATLKAQHLRLFRFDGAGNLQGQLVPSELNGRYGRLRTAQLGPDGNLYITTSNGTNDRILRVRPVTDNDPRGVVGILRVAANGDIKVAGRVHDPNRPFQPVRVVVRIDGEIRRVLLANKPLPNPIPGAGRLHRFFTTFRDEPPGAHTVCVRARNLGPGEDVRLACKRLVVPG